PGFTFIADTTGNDTLFVNARTITAAGTTRTSFVLYPNPASKYVIWQQPVTTHRTRLQLVDMTGRVLKQIVVGRNTPQTTISLNGLQAGVYKLMWTDGQNKLSRTLLIK
ncbi:T9SS type A sorting domain-containing protein, partial [Niastella populi]|uniref:T9SS type A sorting domain-containing protein n=1 Tax=Niastella populi TaxID=550983 RepID=UPI0010569E10